MHSHITTQVTILQRTSDTAGGAAGGAAGGSAGGAARDAAGRLGLYG